MGDIGSLMEKFDSLKIFVDDVCHAFQVAWQGVEDFFSDVPDWFERTIRGPLVSKIESISRAVSNAIATLMEFFGLQAKFNASGGGGSSSYGTFSAASAQAASITAPAFAGGGVMQSAGLFWANENGKAEMVGRFGSHVGVANSDQIVSGIRMGVSDANDGVITAIYAVAQQIIAAMREQDGRGGDLDLGKLIAQQQRNSARLNG